MSPPKILPLLTTVAQVRALPAKEARRAYPVRLKGVVVFCSQKTPGNFAIHDSTGDIFVVGSWTNFPTIKRGQIVEMEGVSEVLVTASADVHLVQIRITGETEIPPPRLVTLAQLSRGSEDSQWVEVRGILRSVSNANYPPPEPLTVSVMTEGGPLVVRVEKYDLEKIRSLMDAEVRIRGLCFNFYNQKRQIFNVRVAAQEMEDIIIEKLPQANPFDLPIQSVNQLLQFDASGKSEHRVRVQGVVSSPVSDGSFYIQDSTQGVQIYSAQTNPYLEVGDRVNVLGYAEMAEYSPVLQNAIFEKLGTALPQSPIPVTAQEALLHDTSLIRIRARLLDRMNLPGETVLVLQATNSIFNAHLHPMDIHGALSEVRNGSLLELTGICMVRVGDVSDYLKKIEGRTPRSFGLLLRSANDIVVLQKPSWWMLTRVLWILGFVTAICLGAIVWVVALKSRVRGQTDIISQKIEREARMEERTRISRELHDTLQQSLAGLRMQLDASITFLEVAPEKVRDALLISRAMVDHSQTEARRSVWDLRSHVLETSGLAGAFHELITPLAGSNRTEIEIHVIGLPRRLPMVVETNVLRIGQESVSNALKHAASRLIRIELIYRPDEFALRVSNDGNGFDPSATGSISGHFGLLGMRERANKINAQFFLQSDPVAGTVIEIVIPTTASRTDAISESIIPM